MLVRQLSAALTLAAVACTGCATVSLREDGSTAYLGCGRFETSPAESAGAFRGEYLEVRVAGLLILSTPFSKALALGLSRERSVLLGGDSSVTLGAALPLQPMTKEMNR